MKAKFHILASLTLIALAGSGGAQAIPLSELLAGQSIRAGDKLFDKWRLLRNDYSDPALEVDPANIDVTALNDGGRDPGPGLRFVVLNDEFTVVGDGLYAYIDYMFGFRVTAPLKHPVKDNTLRLVDGLITGEGDNGVFIQELVGTEAAVVEDPALADLGIKEVEISWLDSSLGGPGAIISPSDSAEFAPHAQVYVSKNILVWATNQTEVAGLYQFEQRFSQTPEPTALSLMIVGLAGLGALRRR